MFIYEDNDVIHKHRSNQHWFALKNLDLDPIWLLRDIKSILPVCYYLCGLVRMAVGLWPVFLSMAQYPLNLGTEDATFFNIGQNISFDRTTYVPFLACWYLTRVWMSSLNSPDSWWPFCTHLTTSSNPYASITRQNLPSNTSLSAQSSLPFPFVDA